MKKNRITFYQTMLIILAISLIGCTTENSPLRDDIDNKRYADLLEERLSDLPPDAEVAIALVQEGQVEYIGVQNQNGVLRGTANANHIFEIGSITKVFTGISLSALISEQRAALNDRVEDQLGYPLRAGGEITLAQLATHTSGLPSLPTNVDEVKDFDIMDPYASYSGDNLQSYLQNHMPLDIAVGTSYEYSNLGMGILGYTLAQMANTTYEDLLKNTLTSHLDMTQTTTLLTNVDPELLVTPRTRQGEITSHWNFDETMSGAGSVKSSVQDMAKFIQYNFRNDEIVNRAQQAAFTIDNNLSMGLGWLIYEDEVFRIHTHDGGTGGFSSILMMDKEKQIGVIVLSNVANYDEGISPLCNDFILELYGRL